MVSAVPVPTTDLRVLGQVVSYVTVGSPVEKDHEFLPNLTPR